MLDYKVKIGIAPVRRLLGKKTSGMFNHAAAKAMKDRCIAYLRKTFGSDKVEFIDIEWFNDEGLMSEWDHAFPIAERFKQEKINGLFVINCNFGEEEVAAKLAQLCDVPTCIL